MADEEHVGGIGVSATVDLGGLDRDLAAMLAKMQKAADQAQGILNGVNARVSSTQQTSARSGGSGSNQPARVTIDTTKLEAKIEGLGGKITELIAALGRLNLSAASGGGRQAKPDTSVEDTIAQYPPHMQAQIRAAMGSARMVGETRPAESFRPAQQVQAQRVAIVTDKPIQVVSSQQERTYQQGQETKRRTARKTEAREDAEVEQQTIAIQPNMRVSRLPRDPDVEALHREQATRQQMFLRDLRGASSVRTGPADAGEQRLLDALFPSDAQRIAQARYRSDAYATESNASGGRTSPRSAFDAPTWADRAREAGMSEGAYRQQVEAERAAAESIRAERERTESIRAERERTEGRRTDPPPSDSTPPRSRRRYEDMNSEDQRRYRENDRAEQAASDLRQRRARQARRAETQRRNSAENARTNVDLRLERAGATRRLREAQIERQFREAQATREAEVTTSGRTSRTTASGYGAFYAGPKRQMIEAQAELSAAKANLSAATQLRRTYDDEILKREVRANAAQEVGRNKKAAALRAEAQAIRDRPDYAKAIEDEQQALEKEAVAVAKVERLGKSAGTALKTLGAVTLAGAAFGVGLKIVDLAAQAAEKSIGEVIDRVTGYGATSTKVTTALGQQTLALKGNADAAIATAAAQAGLSVEATDFISTQLKLVTQVKAGALAQQQASELFRAGYGAGNAPTGLYGGYGGVGGTALLAEQLGGGRGFTEQVLKDVGGMNGKGGPDLLGAFNNAFAYLSNEDVRKTVNDAAREQGNPFPMAFDQSLRALPGIGTVYGAAVPSTMGPPGRASAFRRPEGEQSTAYRDDLNEAARRGAGALGDTDQATMAYSTSAREIEMATRAAAQAGDTYGVTLAQQYGIVLRLNDAVVQSGADYQRAAQQFAVGRGIQDPATMERAAKAAEVQRQIESRASVGAIKERQAFELEPIMDAIERQFSRQISVVNPAMAALSNLASPPTPVGTGIVTRNAGEQNRVNDNLERAAELQDTLNTYYQRGYDILRDTYQIPAPLLQQIGSIGQEIAATQAGIANQQAQYQVAQINYQLHIARRTLSDIGGLTGRNFGEGQSYLGVLERQNLALSRQAQILQFSLAQRQINFNLAVAGFQVPGLTPAEQNARVTEAKKEAEFAQKQLDIQKQMFRNQVQIVDIQNLRAGRDLAQQIGLMLQGRSLVLDTASAQQKIERLQKTQQALMADAEAYINKTDARVSAAEKAITEVAMAAGRELTQMEKQGIAMAYKVGRAFFIGATGGFLGGGNSPTSGGGEGGTGGTHTGKNHAATGALFTANTATDWTFGEAGRETVAILRNPRSVSMAGMAASGGGGGDTYVTFGDVTVRSQGDIDEIVRKITRAQGRDASLRGLRSPN